MSEPFLGEISMCALNFTPRGWAFCNGALLPVAQNTALFSLLGTTYGGDGRTTFGLPNLIDRAAMHPGRGPGLTARRLGESGGTTTATVALEQLPNHNHTMGATTGDNNSLSPANAIPGTTEAAAQYRLDTDTTMAATAIGAVGGNQPHNNQQPYLGLSFIIAITGLYPSRS